MPNASPHALVWSQTHEHDALLSHGQAGPCFRPGDVPAFSGWLQVPTSFAFVGRSGRLSVIKDERPSGTGYWDAYRKQHRRSRKCYLGRSDKALVIQLSTVKKHVSNLFAKLEVKRRSQAIARVRHG